VRNASGYGVRRVLRIERLIYDPARKLSANLVCKHRIVLYLQNIKVFSGIFYHFNFSIYNMFYDFNYNVHIYTLVILPICEIPV
jgi:hypothetical protein